MATESETSMPSYEPKDGDFVSVATCYEGGRAVSYAVEVWRERAVHLAWNFPVRAHLAMTERARELRETIAAKTVTA